MTMTDAEFLRAFEDCTLPGASFHHREHVRLAWLCVRESGEAGAETRIAEGIRRYAESLGATAKYHHTLTLFWVRVCASALRATPGLETFDEFAAAHPHLLDKALVDRHYSAARLASPAAREDFLAPDLAPLA